MRKRRGTNVISRSCWTEDDNQKLREMYDQCYGITEMGVLLGRTEGAVFQQIEALGLSERVYKPRIKKLEYKCQCRNCTLTEICSHPQFCPRFDDV